MIREVKARTCFSPEPLHPLTLSVLIRRATEVPRFITVTVCVQNTPALSNTQR